jgi:hypothetical protein
MRIYDEGAGGWPRALTRKPAGRSLLNVSRATRHQHLRIIASAYLPPRLGA